MSVKALAINYLQTDAYPVSLCLVNQKNHITHEHDFTELEHYHVFMEIVNVMVNKFNNPQIIAESVYQLDRFNALFILESKYRTRYHFKNKLQLTRSELAKIEILLNRLLVKLKEKRKSFQIILVNRLQELFVLLSLHCLQIETTEALLLIPAVKVLGNFEIYPDNKIYINELAKMAHMLKRNFQRIFKCALRISHVKENGDN